MATEIDTIEIGSASSVRADIEALKSGNIAVFSSIEGTDFASKLATFGVISNSEPIAEHLGEEFALANFVIQIIEMADTQSGEMREVPRVILVDDKGAAIHGISGPLMRALSNIVGLVGEPKTWPAPIPVKIVEDKSNAGRRFFDLKLV